MKTLLNSIFIFLLLSCNRDDKVFRYQWDNYKLLDKVDCNGKRYAILEIVNIKESSLKFTAIDTLSINNEIHFGVTYLSLIDEGINNDLLLNQIGNVYLVGYKTDFKDSSCNYLKHLNYFNKVSIFQKQ